MDLTSAAGLAGAGHSTSGVVLAPGPSPMPPVAPVAPPELVGRFQSLMARIHEPGVGSTGSAAGGWHVPQEIVSGVDHQLRERVQALDRVISVDPGNMTLPELEVFQMQSIVQLGTLSMTQSACLQVLSSAKSSVSDLMKNQ